MSTEVSLSAFAASTSQRKKLQLFQVPGSQETTPFAQTPDTGTDKFAVLSTAPSRSVSRAMVTLPRSPLDAGCTSTSSIVAVFWHAMFGANVRLFSTVEIRSEEHTSELQSRMRISYAVFSCKKKKT